MARSRSRRSEPEANYWPGFVDAMATLLLVFIFLLSLFMLSQFLVSQEITGKDTALQKLNSRILQLTELLALERSAKEDIQTNLAGLTSSLGDTQDETKRLQALLDQSGENGDKSKTTIIGLKTDLDKEKELSTEALSRVDLLNQQMAALRRQIATLNAALEASEKQELQSQGKITNLGKRLNLALAKKVQQLSRYRSDFFGKLRDLLGNRDDIKVVGDRFVFQSEVLFRSATAKLNPEGLPQLNNIADALLKISASIPDDVDWVLRVDGHTDKTPIVNSPAYPSNWELSTARALSVVRYFISRGIPARRLVAAGFGEFQPVDNGNSPEALRKNRRIELKLTNR